MSHGNDDDAVIILSNSAKVKIPEDKKEKINAILEKANKEADKVINPNL